MNRLDCMINVYTKLNIRKLWTDDKLALPYSIFGRVAKVFKVLRFSTMASRTLADFLKPYACCGQGMLSYSQ